MWKTEARGCQSFNRRFVDLVIAEDGSGKGYGMAFHRGASQVFVVMAEVS